MATISKEHEKDNTDSKSITIEGIGVDENSESLTKCLEKKSEVTTQNRAINEALDKLNEKLYKVMTILQRNTDTTEQLNNDLTSLKKDVQGKFEDMKRVSDEKFENLKKNVMVPKQNVPDEDMTSLVLELKSCIKSCQSIEKDYSGIKEKIHKVYGRNFFDH